MTTLALHFEWMIPTSLWQGTVSSYITICSVEVNLLEEEVSLHTAAPYHSLGIQPSLIILHLVQEKVVQSTHWTAVLASKESITSSTTQQVVMVVQSQHTILYFTLVEPTPLFKNSAKNGGAIITSNTVLNLSGNNNFIKNSARHGGGVIVTLDNITFSFIGTNKFINNSAHWNGGAIVNLGNMSKGINKFINNSAGRSGGAIFANHTALSFSRTNNFINNSANWIGGAIFNYDNIMSLTSMEPASSSTTQQVVVELLVQIVTVQ